MTPSPLLSRGSTAPAICPIHGIIESPTWHEDEIAEDSGWYCPINLTGKAGAMHDGITDQVCGTDVVLLGRVASWLVAFARKLG